MVSSESDVIGSEIPMEGLGELEGVDFLVDRSKGCSPFPKLMGCGDGCCSFTSPPDVLFNQPDNPSPSLGMENPLISGESPAGIPVTPNPLFPGKTCATGCGGRPSLLSRALLF